MSTTKTPSKTATTEVAHTPTILDTAPEFVKAKGRVRSAIRTAIESLEVGQFLDTGEVADEKAIANTRTKVYAIVRDPEFVGRKFTVRTSVENRVVVGRTL